MVKKRRTMVSSNGTPVKRIAYCYRRDATYCRRRRPTSLLTVASDGLFDQIAQRKMTPSEAQHCAEGHCPAAWATGTSCTRPTRRITLQGICVGPVSSLTVLVHAGIKPQVHEVFAFEQAKAGYVAPKQDSHFGKLVIKTGVQVNVFGRCSPGLSGNLRWRSLLAIADEQQAE